MTFLRMNRKRARRDQLSGFHDFSKWDVPLWRPSIGHQRRRASIIALSLAKRSKGTEIVYSTPRPSREVTIPSLKNALSMRISISAPGIAARTSSTQRATKPMAPLESWTLPAR